MITATAGRLGLALALAALLAACAARPLAEWRDTGFSGTVDNILIIGVSEQPVVRRLFEDTFVKELADLGVAARSSYRVLTDEQISSKEALDAAIRGQSMDAVLVTRVLGVEEIETYTRTTTVTSTMPSRSPRPATGTSTKYSSSNPTSTIALPSS